MSSRPADASFQPVAGIMAVALPGLGYLWFGDFKRAILVFVGVMGLFASGIFIGGIDSVDRLEDKWWFLLQAGMGPTAFATDAVHQNVFKMKFDQARPMSPHPIASRNPGGVEPKYAKSVGRVNEAGMLMTALAGMMNIIAVIDCFWHPTSRTRRRDDSAGPVTLRVGGAPGTGAAS